MFGSRLSNDALFSTSRGLVAKKTQSNVVSLPLSLYYAHARASKLRQVRAIAPYLDGPGSSRLPETSKTLAYQIHVVARLLRGAYRHYRVLFGLTVNGQKTRSNAKTMRRISLDATAKVLTRLRLSKKSIGKIFGDSDKAKRLRAKFKPSIKGAKAKSQKKKPTVRSRDSKKSVWS